MGRSHCLCGLIVGVGTAGLLDHAPLPVRLLAIPVVGGSALLPDLDTRSSTAARSLGFLTRWIARGIAAVSVEVYQATRTELDSPSDGGGHRRLTHTVPGCAGFGVVTLLAHLAHPGALVAVLTLLCGLTSLGVKAASVGVTAGSAGLAWVAVTQYPGWWWLWPLLVTLGGVTHLGGDGVTNTGVPAAWPLRVQGQRWHRVRTRVTFGTGTHVETEIVTPVLLLALGVTAGCATGLVPALVRAWWVTRGA